MLELDNGRKRTKRFGSKTSKMHFVQFWKPSVNRNGHDCIFTVHESVQSPFMGASLIVSDSANLLNDLPIQGGEDVEIQLKHTFDDAPVVYRFKVYKIAGRFVKNKQQIYNLGLISSEALLNETIRVQQALKGNPEAIIQKLLGNEYLDSAKTFYSEPSRFEVNMIANRRRPFDIIAKLLSKSSLLRHSTDYQITIIKINQNSK